MDLLHPYLRQVPPIEEADALAIYAAQSRSYCQAEHPY